MVPEQTIEDIFNGIKFTWSFHSGLAEIGSSSSSSKNGKNCCFKLAFENTCKEFVNSCYIPHIIKEAEIYEFKNRGKKLFTNSRSGDYWSQVCLFSHPSTFDTIAIDPVLKQEIQEDLKKFVNRSDFYNRVGKAWKRGYLLYGPPGTGKTSLIAAIANYLEYDVYDMELTSVKSNAQLKKLLISTPSKSVIVIEDIDCSIDLSNRVKKNNQEANEDRDESSSNVSSGVSLSGVLNFVDGLWSPCAGERLIIFTTNHKEKLDPALLRSGRMDKHICLSYCNMESFKILARSYLKIEEHELLNEVKELLCSLEITPADVAECFMKYDEDPDMGMRIVVEEMKKRLKKNNQGDKTDQAQTDKRFSSCNKILSKMLRRYLRVTAQEVFFKLCFEEKHKEFVDSAYIPHIMKEAEISKFKNRRKKLFTNRSGDCWSQVCQFSHPSTFDTIAMDPVLKQEIQADLKKFVNKSKFYTSVGKAWKRGYLLYGPPGTGKTSLIAAIANFLDFDIYDMELTSVKNNSQLKRLLISTSSKSVIVLEDIDCSLDLSNRKENNYEGCYEEKQKTNGTSSVSLSGILNFVDGLWSPCAGERLIIFTTNHKEKLDPALLRSGRMDKHISLSFCNMESFRILAKNYLKVEEHELMKEVEELISSIQMTPADVAECFMSYDEDPDMGMRNVVEEMKRIKEINQKHEEKTDQTKKRLRSTDEENKELKRLRTTGDDPKQDLERNIPLTKQEIKNKAKV
ncbi:hypothetical protein MKW92_019789 [Papaver armeniacum]|nr:hypothetical protein MKW92_019789 [Papaver armeniacum]